MTVVSVMLLWALPAAQAAETIYWSNYSSNSLAFANLDGSGGGGFDTAGQEVVGSEGLAIDSATGRLYWANFSSGPGNTGSIRYAGLAGGDGGQLNTGAATVNEPAGVAIDPVSRTIFWTNYDGGVEEKGTIGFAKLDDSGGGGNLDLSGATPPNGIYGLAVNPAVGQIYWIDNNGEHISHANLSGGGGGDFDYGTAPFEDPYGLAFDPTSGKIYWANYGNSEVRTGVFGFVGIGGGNGGIDVASAPVDGPQNPVILKGPS